MVDKVANAARQRRAAVAAAATAAHAAGEGRLLRILERDKQKRARLFF